MTEYYIGDLNTEGTAEAPARYADLNARESANGGRVLGGDKGDLVFSGYSPGPDGATLHDVRLRSTYNLDSEEAVEIASSIVAEAVASIGWEAIA